MLSHLQTRKFRFIFTARQPPQQVCGCISPVWGCFISKYLDSFPGWEAGEKGPQNWAPSCVLGHPHLQPSPLGWTLLSTSGPLPTVPQTASIRIQGLLTLPTCICLQTSRTGQGKGSPSWRSVCGTGQVICKLLPPTQNCCAVPWNKPASECWG